MRVVIVGASGNVGTALIEALTATPEVSEIVAAARRMPTPVPDHHGAVDVSWHVADIARDDLDPLLADADVVVNLAWLFHPSHHPDVTWGNNVLGAQRLIEAAERGAVKALVVSSSIAAYSPRSGVTPVDESWPTHGTSAAAYSREKAYVERLLDIAEERTPRLRVVRMRPAFIFHRRAATQQRRLFAGPLLPGSLVRPGLVPLLPIPSGLVLQTVHADDIGRAFAAAVVSQAAGAFNLCADEVLGADELGKIFTARTATVPPRVFKTALRAAWSTHLAPAAPELFDALMRVPVMANTRAADELGWRPRISASDALADFLVGLRSGEGYPTPPLDPRTSGWLRRHEVATGVDSRD